MSRHCITTFLGAHGLRVAALALLWGMTAGCSSSRPVVEGTVTLDGEPIEKGTIELLPSDGKGPTAGCGIEAGKYRMPAAPGSRQVVIRASRKDGKMPDPMSPGSGTLIDRYVEYVPARYNEKTELTVTIKPGLNKHDFKLEGGARPAGARPADAR